MVFCYESPGKLKQVCLFISDLCRLDSVARSNSLDGGMLATLIVMKTRMMGEEQGILVHTDRPQMA